jgi:hypothetical protein
MKNRIQIISNVSRLAKVELLVPFSDVKNESERGAASFLSAEMDCFSQPAGAGGNTFQSIDELRPVESDYIYPTFRALSASVIPGYWLDYTAPSVLESSTALLEGQTVYKNHDFMDVEQWVGVVNRSYWDSVGERSGGIPGINVEMKIDWKMNPRIARGLMMQPPAIHSASVTVLFEFDYSHAELAEQGRFWEMLGEELDGERVRLLVTKILGYWEISLVFQGADQRAKQLSDVEGEADQMSLSTGRELEHLHLRLEHKSDFPPQLIEALGLSTGEDVDLNTEVVTAAINKLKESARIGDSLLATARAEALRLARLTERDDSVEPGLPIEQLINSATSDELTSITRLYAARAARKFPHTCQNCGTQSQVVRSSIEKAVDQGGVGKEKRIADALH